MKWKFFLYNNCQAPSCCLDLPRLVLNLVKTGPGVLQMGKFVLVRLGANSGMYIFHTFFYKLDAKKLQMY